MKPIRPNPIALCLAVLLLSACAGGSGGDMVRTSTPPDPDPPDPPPPPPPPFDPCPAPVTSNCIVTLGADDRKELPATQSDHAFRLLGNGQLDLYADTYRFGGGTRIEGGTLNVGGSQTILQSNVQVLSSGHLVVVGNVQGNVENHGTVELWERISGNLANANRLWVSAAAYGNQPLIGGDFSQSDAGVLEFTLAPAQWDGPVALQITGRADLAGTLQLGTHSDAWGPYALPDARAHHIIHANGGVFGQFAQWTSPGLAITGSLRYGTNDVWFDLTRISLQAAMAARGVDHALPLASASNLDRALAGADGFALASTTALSDAQRRFLASAASIMWLQDTAQALRSFDSLAGHAHAAMPRTLQRDAARASARLDARLVRQPYATTPLAWSATPRPHLVGHGLAGPSAGIDHWLSPHLLVGGSVTHGQASLRLDHLGGQAWGTSPGAGLHVHYRGNGWHATGALGAAHTQVQLQRPIELGAAGAHLAHSQRSFVHGFLHGELGRDLSLAGGTLMPFVALDYGFVRSDAFAERGDTGLELIAGSSRQTQFSAAVGARYARAWAIGRHRLQLELDARYRRDLFDEDSLQAAFRGVPEAWFDVPVPRETGASELRVGLGGEFGRHSLWWMDYAHGVDGDRRDAEWRLGLRHAF